MKIHLVLAGLVAALGVSNCAASHGNFLASSNCYGPALNMSAANANDIALRKIKPGRDRRSIGGAGTFDGIVLSGLIAAYLS